MNFLPINDSNHTPAGVVIPGHNGLFRVSRDAVQYDPKRYRLMNGRLWRIVGGTNSSPTLMTIPEIDALSRSLGSLGDLSPREVLSVQSQQANAAVAFLASAASTGARTPRAAVQAWQRAYNARVPQLQEAARALGQTALANAIRALTVDGYWGANTAFSTAVWISTSAPPSRLADVARWWSTNNAAIGGRRDAIAEAYRQAIAAPSAPAPAPAAPSPAAPPPQPPAPPPPPAGQPYDASTPSTPSTPEPSPYSYDPPSSGGAGSSGGSSALLLGAVVVLAIGGVVLYRSKTKDSSDAPAPRRKFDPKHARARFAGLEEEPESEAPLRRRRARR